jgi:CheY-like chemotaxis protein
MKILLADDDLIPRTMLRTALTEWGFAVETAGNGIDALRALQKADAPKLALLDWEMPGVDGVEVCRRIRAEPTSLPPYLILLTGRDNKSDVIAGLENGANDYVTKPFNRAELKARIQVGQRVLELQQNLAGRVRELEDALAQVKQLQELLPICCYCKKIRDDKNYWQQVESYFTNHSETRFSHCICPECWESTVQPQLAELEKPQPAPVQLDPVLPGSAGTSLPR